jgi:hypothetical protein
MTKLAIPGSLDARGPATFRTSTAFLRQPIFEPLSDVLIASRQINPGLVTLLRELGRFSWIRPSVRVPAKINGRIAIADIPFGPLKILIRASAKSGHSLSRFSVAPQTPGFKTAQLCNAARGCRWPAALPI